MKNNLDDVFTATKEQLTNRNSNLISKEEKIQTKRLIIEKLQSSLKLLF